MGGCGCAAKRVGCGLATWLLWGCGTWSTAPVVHGTQNVDTLNSASVQQVVWDHREAVAGCWRRASADNPGVAGRLVLRWQIDDEGRVTSMSTTEDSTQDEVLGACIEKVVQRLQFPAPLPGEQVDVRYPFAIPRCVLSPARSLAAPQPPAYAAPSDGTSRVAGR